MIKMKKPKNKNQKLKKIRKKFKINKKKKLNLKMMNSLMNFD